MTDAPTILRAAAEQVEAHLRQVARRGDAPARLVEAMQYSLLAGGKRLRPALVIESARACAADENVPPEALTAAAAIELIHTFSLVHDDLPAMDDDDLRRGRPTNHKVFGEAMAILAGDAMVMLAFDIIAMDVEPSRAIPLIRELAHASGPEGMIGGQVLDMQGQNIALTLEQLQTLHRMKTGALLRAACRMGAIAAGATDAQIGALTNFGEKIGLAFQIVDDLLDVTATPEQLGKATGKDKSKGKNTYPNLLGLESSRAQARHLAIQAADAIAPLGSSGQNLRILAAFVIAREI